MRSITVTGRCPVRKACIAVTICVSGTPVSGDTGVFPDAAAGWQPEQELAPGGASAVIAVVAVIIPIAIPAIACSDRNATTPAAERAWVRLLPRADG